MEDLSNYRKSYEKSELSEALIPNDPMELFGSWFNEVRDSGGVDEVNAMTVATAGLDGFPRSRVVLLKQFTDDGFVFYTNYNSEKGKALAVNPRVCLSFFWPALERQVIIKGIAEQVAAEVSDAYFASRPLGSQLGALASHQSEVVASRDVLDEKLMQLEQQYASGVVPRPAHWGGYLVRPVEVEFWQGRQNRMHDRIRYKKTDNGWTRERLAP